MKAYIKIAGLENIVEAQLMVSILEEKEIPHRIRSFHDTAYDGLFQFQKGWGRSLHRRSLMKKYWISLPWSDRRTECQSDRGQKAVDG